jgi:DNA-binding transcriptional MerR regulator
MKKKSKMNDYKEIIGKMNQDNEIRKLVTEKVEELRKDVDAKISENQNEINKQVQNIKDEITTKKK